MGQESVKSKTRLPKPSIPPSFDRAEELTVGARPDSLRWRRCAFCHEDIGRALSRSCEGCGITLHDLCCREAKRCPSIGCEQEWDRELRSVRRVREEAAAGRRETLHIVMIFAFSIVSLAALNSLRGTGFGELAGSSGNALLIGLALWTLWLRWRKRAERIAKGESS